MLKNFSFTITTNYSMLVIQVAPSNLVTGEFRRLGRCFIDWATAVVSEVDTCQLSVSFTCHSSGPICETSTQSTKFDGIRKENQANSARESKFSAPFDHFFGPLLHGLVRS